MVQHSDGGTDWSEPADVITLSDPEVIAAFVVSPAASHLGGFVAGPATVGEAAEAMGVPLRRMYRSAQRLLELGLLVEVGSRPRRGRAMRLYRAVARALCIPAGLVPEGYYDRLSQRLDRATRRAVAQAAPHLVVDGDLVLRLQPDGVSIDRVPPSTDPVAEAASRASIPPDLVTTWRTLDLTDADATALAQELWALADRYSARAGDASGAPVRQRWLRIDLVRTPDDA